VVATTDKELSSSGQWLGCRGLELINVSRSSGEHQPGANCGKVPLPSRNRGSPAKARYGYYRYVLPTAWAR